MATKSQKQSPKKQKKVDSATTETNSSLEQVRDILFGEQSQALVDDFTNQLNTLKTETQNQLSKLQKTTDELISSEQSQRKEANSEQIDKLEDLAHNLSELDKKLEGINEQLHDNIQSESKHLSDTMQKLHDEAMATVAEKTDNLQGSKVGRLALAEMFTEIAEKLKSDDV